MARFFPVGAEAVGGRRHKAVRSDILGRYWPILAILVFTFAIRGFTFGNPILDYDEQLYLLVGDRMLQGQLPYVDLWDRKPIGLFLFYAGVRLLGGDGVIQYQIVVALLVSATATIIWILARRSAGNVAAVAVAFAYILFLNPFSGTGGQAPVIYNILTAIGAWACIRADDTQDPQRQFRLALLAMVLVGIAIQMKYTPVVEGMFFGCYFLRRMYLSERNIGRLSGKAVAMILTALAPTLASVLYFWSIGELDSFLQANFVSVFQRNPFPQVTRTQQHMLVLIVGAPLIILAILAAWRNFGPRKNDVGHDLLFISGWSIAALLGFGMLGDFYDFYFITVLPPLLIFIAPTLQRGRFGFAAANLVILGWPLLLSPPQPGLAAERRAATQKLVAAVRPFVRAHCLYVYDGPAALYRLTNACAPTRYIYPDHLNNPTEAPALGVNQVAEVARVLATRPGAIVTADRSLIPHVTPQSRLHLKAVLARDYVLVARVSVDRIYDVYALRSLSSGRPPLAVPYIEPY